MISFCAPKVAKRSPSGKKAPPRNAGSMAKGSADLRPVARSRLYNPCFSPLTTQQVKSGDTPTRFLIPGTTPSDAPEGTEDSLRKALTFGADRAVLLTDRFFAGADTLATTYALATAIRKIGETFGTPDIIFTGKQTIDGDTAQVGPGIAKRLGLLQLTYVAKIGTLDLAGRTIEAERGGPRAACKCCAPGCPA